MTSLIMAAILLFGIVGYRSLPVSDLPNVDFPTILVTASLPGASPETMSSSVATPLERQFSTIEGVDSISSVSSLGSTQITIQFDLSRDLDAAAQDLRLSLQHQGACAADSARLPSGLPAAPALPSAGEGPLLGVALSARSRRKLLAVPPDREDAAGEDPDIPYLFVRDDSGAVDIFVIKSNFYHG